MATNVGKKFEQDFKNSLPFYVLPIRLPDPPQAFAKRSDTRFSHKNPCDYILYDSKHRILIPSELKTTKYRSMSFDDINCGDKQNNMIHKHQILGLKKFSEYDYVIAGFFFNFRSEEHDIERLYFQRIEDFLNMISDINKKSFNEIDLCYHNAVKIKGEKKRTRYCWNMDEFIENIDYYNSN